jgi:uncharacterized membrane protein
MFDTTNLHPMIVHFPIALLIVGFLSDIIGLASNKEFFHKAAFYLLVLGTAGVIAAYLSGNSAGESVNEAGALKIALDIHENAALITLWIIVTTALIRIVLVMLKRFRGVYKWATVVIFAAGIVSVANTGHYGGQLVYKHAAGVQLMPDAQGNENNKNEKKDKERTSHDNDED